MDRRQFLAVAAAAGALSILPSCNSSPSQNSTTGGLRNIKVAQWGQEKYLIYLPFYIAQEAGLFAAHGLDVELGFNGNDDQVFAAVLRGDANFGIGDPIFAAISRNRGGDGVVVGQLVDRVALWGVSRAGEKRRALPADFAGARIGTFPRPSTTYTLVRDMVDQGHVPGAKIIEVPIGSELGLLEQDGADVVMLLEPAASTAAKAGYEIVTSFPKLWGPFCFTGLTSSASYVQKNAEAVAAMSAAMQAALDLVYNHRDQALALATRLFPKLDKDVVTNAVTRMMDEETLPRKFAVSADGWAAAVRVRQELGDLATGEYMSVIK